MQTNIIHGDSLKELALLEKDSIDLICTDPPYGYSFMGKDWDKSLPDIKIWRECVRVLKPGAFAFVMSAPRSDVCARMMLDLEDAGFNIAFTPIYWTYASGFPKAMNIGKVVDKRLGATRKRGKLKYISGKPGVSVSMPAGEVFASIPESPQAKALDGSYGGFQPKPAVEVIIVAMKPLSEKTFVDQALKNGKGITWLDDCKVPGEERNNTPMGVPANSYGGFVAKNPTTTTRFPANLIAEDNVLNDYSHYFDLDAWSQTLPFLIVPKASKGEKNEGLDDLPIKQTKGGGGMNDPHLGSAYGSLKAPAQNFHPTVKPLKLMSYLITLGSRPGDTVLDPFVGSGTTALAAENLGRIGIGIEREEEYAHIARARLKNAKPIQLQIAAV